MLTERPWRLEAVIRLLAGMLACVFLGSLLLTVVRFDPATSQASGWAFYGLASSAALTLLAALWIVVQPWRLEQFKLRAGLLLIFAYAGLALSGAAQRVAGPAGSQMTVLGMVINAACFQGASIPLMWLLVRQHGMGLREGFGLNINNRHALLLGATVAFAYLPFALGLQFGTAMIAHALNIELPTQNAVVVLRLADSWVDRFALGFVTVLLAPIAEEGLFRGIFYPAIKGFGFPKSALWVTSIVFALIHNNVMIFLPLLVLAVVLTKLYEKTGNLLSCIACHATFNLFNFVMLFVANQAPSAPTVPQ